MKAHRLLLAALLLAAATAFPATVTLEDITDDVTLQNGDVLTATGGYETHVMIAAGATVTISNAVINGGTYDVGWPGITCLGDATIVLAGENTVKGSGRGYPGIFVPAGNTLTIRGDGSLAASDRYGRGAGIGGGEGMDCGDIVIEGGTVTATGGNYAAGIGSGYGGLCGDIVIEGGTITATGGNRGAGIGCGQNGSCCNISIVGGTVTATGKSNGAGIGTGSPGSCGDIVLSGGTVTATATNGTSAAGIGGGLRGECGNISIESGIIRVAATGGNLCENPIGAGVDGSCGPVTVDNGLEDTTSDLTRTIVKVESIADLAQLTGNCTLTNLMVATGTLHGNYKVSIADGATVTLRDAAVVGVNDYASPWAGITCLGDATIVLEGTNVVNGFHDNHPGVFVPPGKTLTIRGGGSLTASSNGQAAGIGGGYGIACGDIVIEGGTITAEGGHWAAGIGGGGADVSCGNVVVEGGTIDARGGEYGAGIGGGGGGTLCGDIAIEGGTVTATGGYGAAGIGGGGSLATCGNITLEGGIIDATGGEGAAGIGSGSESICGDIALEGGIIDATGGEGAAGIGSGSESLCGDIALAGGTINATGGEGAAGIGSGVEGSSCLTIAVGPGVAFVAATCGIYCDAPIGEGAGGSCDLVTVSSGLCDTTDGPTRTIAQRIVNLAQITGSRTLLDGQTATGTLGGNWEISIAKGATVTISNAVVNGVDDPGCPWAGVTCLGNATIVLEGANVIRGFYQGHPGIHVPAGKTLTVRGGGSLAASANGTGVGIDGTVALVGDLLDTTNGPTRTIAQRTVNLAPLSGNLTLIDGQTATGTLGGNWEISIAKGATVTISNAVVNGVDDPGCPWAGITCLGNATIVLEGTNVVRGFQEDYPGIFVPAGKTLTVRGDGSLTASSNGRAAGIGAGYGIACGNIVVEGGAVHATGGEGAAGIGGGYSASCGAIAIGSGIASVTATCGSPGENPIGAGYGSSCGGVVLGGGLVDTTSGSTRTIVPGIYPGIDYGKTVFLSSVSTNTTVADGFLVMGTLGSQTKISIADGATVTISNVVINGVNDSASRWAGITCLGDATIVLEGTNVVRGFHENHPGIFVPTNKTLTIRGGGSLAASSNGRGAGIGGGSRIDCGDIVVESGTVTATGGSDAAGIGGARTGSCGDIVIGGGTVTATGDTGIGGGYRAPCGDIAIEGGTVTATGNVAAGIGSAHSSACGGITISGGTVTASCGGYYAAGIGSGDDGSCGAISITGGTATATGGAFAVGIGAGLEGYCRSIAMGPDIVRVVATCGEGQNSVRPIGAGDDGSCGAVTIATGLSDTTSGRTRILEPGQIVNLAALEANATFGNGSVLAGTLGGNYGISIADGATVTIRNATINGVDDANFPWAGITCLGDATIVLEGTNVVRGFQEDHPGIFVPTNKTLTIRGGGSLTASSNGRAAGIGGGYGIACGDIVVEGGAVHATGGEGAAGIGGGCNASCGGIVVGPDIVRVTATHGASCDNPIGAGDGGTGGAVAMDDARLTDTTEGPTRIVEPSQVVDLAALTDNATFRDGSVLAGTLGGNYRISIADGATVTISNVVINGVNDSASRWAGITCLGDATIVLEGTNVVRGFHENHPGVFVPSGKTLTIRGGGSLAASSNGYGAGIGGGFRIGCGDIVIESGTVTATGGSDAAGIGGGHDSDCGDIVIGGGTVTATGGSDAAGIGCGSDASCGDITVCDGVTLVIATKGDGNGSQAPIGRSSSGSCGTVTVGSALSDVTSDDGKTRTLSPPLTLADDADNTEILRGKDGRTYRTVVLSGRTLYRDGRWNTLCLPFSIDDFTGSPLEGATAMALGSAALNGGLLALDFTNATSIAAGRPYLVRWDDLVIGSAAEWDAFAARVDGGTTYEGKMVRLSADIRVTTMVGTDEHPFRGVFDGAGHTLDVAIDAGETDCAAPFHAIGAAVVRNLVVTGTVSGGIHCAGLVGKCTDGTSLIQSCDVRTDIVCGGNYCGGILGHSGTVDATIRDCRFGGSIVGAANAIGILFGWGDRPGNHVIDHCLADGTYREGGNIDLLRQNSGNATVEACYKTQNIGSQGTYTTQTGDNLAAQLGDGNWEASGGTAVPKMVASPNVTDPAFQDATIGTALAADEFGCVSFIGDTSPVTLLAGDRTAILVGADGALGVPETETTVNSCRARFRLNGAEAGDDVRYYAMNLGDATMAGKFVEVCEHPGVGPCEMCPYCGERTPLRYLDPADAAEPVKTCADYAIYGSENTLTSGWWVVEGVVTNDTRIEIAGEIHLILRDGAELTAAKGIHVAGANSLAVWAQSGERATAGKLTVSEPDNCLAGIGGNDGESGGTVTVNGGVLDVTGGYKSAAIGGARCGAGGTTTVNGGFVTATGGNWGAGIGGGMAMNANYTSGNAGIVTINGGEVTASGGSWCAGIGGAGGTDSENGGSGGTVAINGGTVTANGGNWSAGIGGGRYGGGVAVVIRGGTVTAETGGGAQAIGEGDGWSGDAGSIAIDGMRVFGSPDATEPVAAESRENACRGTWAKLESCPHLYEDDICLWCGRADPTIAYRAWAGANGVAGAWNAKDALGVHNVFRYAFDHPSGAFADPPLLSIAFDADGNPVVLTPPLVNAEGFDLSLLATEDAAGTSNAVPYPLDPSGTNAIPGEIAPARFFRLKATEAP